MGAFRLLLGTLHYIGLYLQLSASTRQGAHGGMENQVSGNAMFTEVPHDMTAQRGQDVEMACSFRGAGMPSYSLEIQWWYIRNHLDWTDRQPWTTNEVAPEEEMPKDATKISVVKVVGSNISHKLRLSRVKPSDEGTYECRVIDFSADAGARHHRVRAYLQVLPESNVVNANDNFNALDDTKQEFDMGDDTEPHHTGVRGHTHGHHGENHHQEHSKRPSPPAHHAHSHGSSSQPHKAGGGVRKRDVDTNHSVNDCTNEPSCVL
ncbi:V-set and transmembrane domain-containing protein 2-like protein [Gouania willdenowi]|uniref:V-set and transmembrane domain-containing protein 2-like protein n=1 Tax=Gouania willdenowi TaxID=441366 RepID=A0A8C5E1F1_GOUWI|nr:V-set and transmembrane domain-containing protein 2-like protein [Gouania willdenowi]